MIKTSDFYEIKRTYDFFMNPHTRFIDLTRLINSITSKNLDSLKNLENLETWLQKNDEIIKKFKEIHGYDGVICQEHHYVHNTIAMIYLLSIDCSDALAKLKELDEVCVSLKTKF